MTIKVRYKKVNNQVLSVHPEVPPTEGRGGCGSTIDDLHAFEFSSRGGEFAGCSISDITRFFSADGKLEESLEFPSYVLAYHFAVDGETFTFPELLEHIYRTHYMEKTEEAVV